MLILGDFNSVLQPELDRLRSLKLSLNYSGHGVILMGMLIYGECSGQVTECTPASQDPMQPSQEIDYALATRDFFTPCPVNSIYLPDSI